MEAVVLNTEGKETKKKVELTDSIYGVDPNDHAIYLDVKQYLANQRQGTHKSKQRNEISGSTRKLHKQKGTGGSRKGSIKNPLFRGGGRIFGPQPRDYSFKLNKKVKRLARISALSHKAKDNQIMIVEDFAIETPKTKRFLEILSNLKANGTTLLVVPQADKNVVLSARNISSTKVTTATELNTYDIMNARYVILAESSVKKIEENLLS